jgi:hypothetical protein
MDVRIDRGWSVFLYGSRTHLVVLGRESVTFDAPLRRGWHDHPFIPVPRCTETALRVRSFNPDAPETLVGLGEIDHARLHGPDGLRLPTSWDGLGCCTTPA